MRAAYFVSYQTLWEDPTKDHGRWMAMAFVLLGGQFSEAQAVRSGGLQACFDDPVRQPGRTAFRRSRSANGRYCVTRRELCVANAV